MPKNFVETSLRVIEVLTSIFVDFFQYFNPNKEGEQTLK
jgi:hypothetical protein